MERADNRNEVYYCLVNVVVWRFKLGYFFNKTIKSLVLHFHCTRLNLPLSTLSAKKKNAHVRKAIVKLY